MKPTESSNSCHHKHPISHHHFNTEFSAHYLPLKSISSSAQYVTMEFLFAFIILQKYVSHPSLDIYFLPTPPIKPKLLLQIGGTLLQ
jgi:hypothetical protein